ncbi:MAG: hypothetical protein IJ408_04555 [Clostridia bacterium]|nr:hypothetical protein [Clostridia bacterium]
MNRTKNFLIIICVALVFVASFLIMSALTKDPQPAIDFVAGTHTGEVISLYDNLGKTPTALIFIDPEVEGSNEILKKFIARKDKIDVIAISVSELPEQEQKKLLPEGWETLPKLCFEKGNAVEKYNIGNAPITYFIDKDCYVVDAYPAGIKDETIDKKIEKLNK